MSEARSFDAVIITTPWGSLKSPSIQLGYLASVAREAGFHVCTHYPGFHVAARIGLESYETVSSDMNINQLFSYAICDLEWYERLVQDHQNAVDDWIRAHGIVGCDEIVDALRAMIDGTLTYLSVLRPKVVGFTVGINQYLLSASLARAIKQEFPDTLIVFGGVHCSGDFAAEILRATPEVDIVCAGEGEIAWLNILRDIQKKDRPCRDRRCFQGLLASMDDLPVPDYDDYWREAEASGLPIGDVIIPYECGRGCWHNQCVYCNYDLQFPSYRAKSPLKACEDIVALAAKYPGNIIEFVDSVQLPSISSEHLMRALSDCSVKGRFAMTIRPDMDECVLEGLARVGLCELFVGIESFSDSLLTRMRRRVTVCRNLSCLVLCKKLGITTNYNLITGFPGETTNEVVETLTVLERNAWLPSPKTSEFHVYKNSEMFNAPESFGIEIFIPARTRDLHKPNLIQVMAYYYDYKPKNAECQRLWGQWLQERNEAGGL